MCYFVREYFAAVVLPDHTIAWTGIKLLLPRCTDREEVTKELPHKEISSLNHKRTSGIPAENSGVIHLAGPRRRIRIRSG